MCKLINVIEVISGIKEKTSHNHLKKYRKNFDKIQHPLMVKPLKV
jgi:hypothetical protein